jgi:hypothetical protein
MKKLRPIRRFVGKNLSQKEAYRRFVKLKPRDFRGWSYDPRTGYMRAI